MLKKLIKSKKNIRLLSLVVIDFFIILFSLYLAQFLTIEKSIFQENYNYKVNGIILIIGIIIYLIGGVYNPLTRYTGSKSFYKFIF